jgi:hypothetical protein
MRIRIHNTTSLGELFYHLKIDADRFRIQFITLT